MSEPLSQQELKKYSIKVLNSIWPEVKVRPDMVTPKVTLWIIWLNQEMLLASAFISFFESIWKATFPGYSNIKTWADIASFLNDSATTALRSYLSGEIKLMVKNVVKIRYRSIVTLYFSGVGDENDFKCQVGFSERMRQLGEKYIK